MSDIQLNERELDILKRLSSGLSDQEIADELFLSLNTVKWYNRQIYSKLGVRNRTQAITQARVSGLLENDVAPPIYEASQLNQPAASHRLQTQQRVYFTNSFDGARLAFAIAGDGEPIVKVANYMGHLEYDWDSPVWKHWLDELTREHTLVRYDERGSGLSDWDVEEISFDSWVHDLEAVVDAVGLRQFPLFAMSQGGAVAVAYAARHPDKVSRLILHGSYARGWLNRNLTQDQIDEEKLLLDLMRVGWGKENPAFRQVFATQLFPDAPTEYIHALEHQMRISVSPENAVRLESVMHRVDVRDLATRIEVPTLALHSRQDSTVPFEEGCYLASLIPNAQFVALESRNHLLMENEPAWQKFVAAVRGFLRRDG